MFDKNGESYYEDAPSILFLQFMVITYTLKSENEHLLL